MARPTIKKILLQSLAVNSPLQPGWQLLRINQKEIGDILDYQIAIADARLVTEWLDLEGVRFTHTFQKPIDKSHGCQVLFKNESAFAELIAVGTDGRERFVE